MMPPPTADTPAATRRRSSASPTPAPTADSPAPAPETAPAEPARELLPASESPNAGVQELLARRQGFADAGKPGDAAAVTARLAELGYR